MPVPGKGEPRDKFISRCIPIVIHEGTTDDPKQAAAICHSIWRKKHPGAKSKEYISTIKSEMEYLKKSLDMLKSKL